MKEKSSYGPALEPKEVGDALIQAHHHHLEGGTPVAYFFMGKGSAAHPFYARARQVKKDNGYVGYMTEQYLQQQGYNTDNVDVFRVIEVVKPLWNELTQAQRVALIDHELCHFAPENKMRRHDLEEFREVVERHGFYLPDVKAFAEAIKKRKEDEKEKEEKAA